MLGLGLYGLLGAQLQHRGALHILPFHEAKMFIQKWQITLWADLQVYSYLILEGLLTCLLRCFEVQTSTRI